MTFLVVYDTATKQRVDYGKLIDKAGGNILRYRRACDRRHYLFLGAVEAPPLLKATARAVFA